MSTRKLYSRRAAKRIAERAAKHGVPADIANYIAFACRKEHLRYAVGFAMFEQESNFENVYGHDEGGLNPGEPVTQENYHAFRRSILASGGTTGTNGVGLGQATYWTYVRDHAGLWKPKVQVYLCTSILADYVHRLGETRGIGSYNGGSHPNAAYAREVLKKAERWRLKLAK